jgi:hypothetical protein
VKEWKKATASASVNCVEVAIEAEQVSVRHSKRPDGPELVYSGAEWDAFIAGAKDGEFDRN